GTAVEQHLHAAVAMAAHDHRMAAQISGDVVARVWHLAAVPHEQPGAAEDALHLELEQIRVGVDAPVNTARLDQFRNFLGVPVTHESFSALIADARLSL